MKELRVALIGGGGFMGFAHSNAYALVNIDTDLDARVIKQVIVDVDAAAAAEAADRLGWEESSDDWRATIARDDIDIVDIVTPPHLHEEIALAAIAAGKNVFCEKPVTNDADEAEQMWEAAKKAGVVTQVGFNYRHTSALGYLKQLLTDGTLGEPLQIRMQYMSEGGFGGPMFGWRGVRSTGGSGMSGDLGSHIIDIATYLFGDISRVTGHVFMNGQVLENASGGGEDLDDSGQFLAQFANGGNGMFVFGTQTWRNYNHITVEVDATKGAARFDWNHQDELQLALARDEEPQGFTTVVMDPKHPDAWWRLAGLGTGYIEPGVTQLRKFVRAITGGTNSHPNFGEAVHVQRVVEAVVRSSDSGQWEDVAPADAAARADTRPAR
jgi:predicted dehydrogenase